MAKRMRFWNGEKFQKYIREGRGQGEGSDYIPWLSIHDFSSRGIVSRVFGLKTKRIHHFLSRNELYFFYLLEWSDSVLDIREQYPLMDVELAIDIAAGADIQYPKDNISGFPYVLTCDFMITTPQGLKARTIKCSSELSNRRTIEKLEIERHYWEKVGINWALVTEREIPTEAAKNIEWLHASAIPSEDLQNPMIQQEFLRQASRNIPVPQIAANIDKGFGLPAGSGFRIFRYLLWTKQLQGGIETDYCLSAGNLSVMKMAVGM